MLVLVEKVMAVPRARGIRLIGFLSFSSVTGMRKRRFVMFRYGKVTAIATVTAAVSVTFTAAAAVTDTVTATVMLRFLLS